MSGATRCALEVLNVPLCNVRVGCDFFIGLRDETRTVTFPHPNGECCICSDEGGLRLKCGHYICPDDILDHAWQQINNLKHKISCASCTTLLDVDDILILGLPDEQEKQFLTTALSVNACLSQDIQQCPRCQSYTQRIKPDDPQVTCIVCTKTSIKPFRFCWYCLGEWNGLVNCGNEFCSKEKIKQLKSSPMKEFKDRDGNIVRFPQVRACPNCCSLLEHESGCNEIKCDFCNHIFCIICLTQMRSGSLVCRSTSWNSTITCIPAPIQTKLTGNCLAKTS
ncbi:E3 ubiquitin-protein ligase RNF19B-like [Oopsacas minuta]|uniref:RBR-type E3 ubiquitin transferase n=1 Tax=Oopsacas minuta TaxID=111878 RepID=A0AAV7KHA8_9METZ|nr:E3 ubiquitin-protein ligase RNF19B-like [Oopsacas minuta]